jgi:hypothetical protein
MIIAAMTAMPPTTPPTMAPVGVEWPGGGVGEFVVGTGPGIVVVVDWTVDDDDVELELELDVVDELYTGIDCVMATKVALGFPPSVATANSVFIVGESSQYQFDAVPVPVASTSRNWLQYGEVGLHFKIYGSVTQGPTQPLSADCGTHDVPRVHSFKLEQQPNTLC